MASSTSAKYIERVLKHEGGWVNHPTDPGGETNLGITWAALRRAQAKGIVPADVTIRSLKKEHAIAIYYEDYYKPYEWIASDALRFQVFDAAVNSGHSRAVGWLQRALGVAVDGVAGPVTKAAAQDHYYKELVAELALKFIANRVDFLNDLTGFDAFGRGWTQRMVDNLRYLAEDL